MSNKTCGECKYYITEMFHCLKHDVMAEAFHTCEDFEPKNPTVFHQITQSPETLAEEFVEMMFDPQFGDYQSFSMLTYEFYETRAEAIAATVAKLKEECDE